MRVCATVGEGSVKPDRWIGVCVPGSPSSVKPDRWIGVSVYDWW